MENRVSANILESHKLFVWLWEKTGTTHMSNLLRNFDFKHYYFDGNDKKLIHNRIIHTHECGLFPGHEDYKLMVSTRNPYSRIVSSYKMNHLEDLDKNTFRDYLETIFYLNEPTGVNCYSFVKRKPDYFVRVEHMYDDYSKIPFIIESDFYKSGKLKQFTDVRLNPHPKGYKDWREYYSKESADIVYYNMARYFDMFGYDKNSYKIKK